MRVCLGDVIHVPWDPGDCEEWWVVADDLLYTPEILTQNMERTAQFDSFWGVHFPSQCGSLTRNEDYGDPTPLELAS